MTYKIIKAEFVKNKWFKNLDELKYEFTDYVHWYNNHQIYSLLGYLNPVQYKENPLKKLFSLVSIIQIKLPDNGD